MVNYLCSTEFCESLVESRLGTDGEDAEHPGRGWIMCPECAKTWEAVIALIRHADDYWFAFEVIRARAYRRALEGLIANG